MNFRVYVRHDDWDQLLGEFEIPSLDELVLIAAPYRSVTVSVVSEQVRQLFIIGDELDDSDDVASEFVRWYQDRLGGRK